MRIDKVLANLNYGSRKEVHDLIKKGLVKVNSLVVRDKGFAIDPDRDTVQVREEVVDTTLRIYIKLNKPAGYITATEDKNGPSVMDLLPPRFLKLGVVPVGRLDKDTEGLLLFSTDGKWGHRIINGKKSIEKKYFFTYEGVINKDGLEQIGKGLELRDGTQYKPAIIDLTKPNEGEIIVTEGKYHQVKRMIQAIGGTVTYLKRMSIGPITLADIEEVGTFSPLTPSEIDSF